MMDTFWRQEVWHPLTVHFPIALLLAATVVLIISFFLKETRNGWRWASTGLLLAGCIAAWISIYTGDLADGIVSRKICDPTVLKDHENASFTTAYLFTGATILQFMALSGINLPVRKIFVWCAACVLLLAGSSFLIYTGHLGATLVYEQGAGVSKPSEDCSDFQ